MHADLYRFSRLALAWVLPMVACAAQMTFVMVPKNDHAYYEPCFEGFSAAAGMYNVAVDRVNPDQSLDQQVKIIQDLIARHVDGIAISALDNAGLVPVIAQATRAGVKVVTFDSAAPSSAALTYIGTNNRRAGFEAGKKMAALMKGKGRLLVLQGGMTALNLNQRTLGFKKALAKYGPRIRIAEVVDIEQNLAVATEKTEAALAKYPDVQAVFAVSSQGAPAAVAVLESQERAGKVLVAGFDDSEATLKGIRSGAIAFCLVQRTFKMGWLSLEALMDARRGEPLEKQTDTRVLFVGRGNVDHYLADMRKELVK
jgi:ribose transport system substrate-binding protein